MDRRTFLRSVVGKAAVTGVATSLGAGFWERALAGPAQPGPSPYGPLLAADANGVRLPAGFTSRVVAAALAPVAGTGHLWHVFPDGGACVPTGDGGWIYLSNSEYPIPDITAVTADVSALMAQLLGGLQGVSLPTSGGVGALRFDAAGTVVAAYPVLTGTLSNCAGGMTPWGTWLSCEEWEADEDLNGFAAGAVWECDPFGERPPVVRPALGRFRHEMAACDPVRQQIHLTEDQADGLLYRYTPPPGTWGSGAALEGGTLEAMHVGADGRTTWVRVADFVDPAAPTAPIRTLVQGATRFGGGEGCLYDDGRVYVTTKDDDRVWVHDVAAQTMVVLYDSHAHPAPVLSGVDNLAVSAAHDLFVAEDRGDLEVCTITPDGVVAAVAQLVGPHHGFDTGTGLPTISEITGLALSPDGNRLYFNSQRAHPVVGVQGPGLGVLYEVTGPFRGGALAAGAAPTTTTTTTAPGGGARIPATGASVPLGAAAVAGAAGAALLHLRTREPRREDRP
jgi:hypothetical protein